MSNNKVPLISKKEMKKLSKEHFRIENFFEVAAPRNLVADIILARRYWLYRFTEGGKGWFDHDQAAEDMFDTLAEEGAFTTEVIQKWADSMRREDSDWRYFPPHDYYSSEEGGPCQYRYVEPGHVGEVCDDPEDARIHIKVTKPQQPKTPSEGPSDVA